MSQKRTITAVSLILLRSAVSILKRKKEEVDLLHLNPEKEEKEEKEKTERVPDHQDQIPALRRRANGAPAPRARKIRNVVLNGKLNLPANGEISANSGTLLLVSIMPKEVVKPEICVHFLTEMAPRIPAKPTSHQQDLLLVYQPSTTRCSRVLRGATLAPSLRGATQAERLDSKMSSMRLLSNKKVDGNRKEFVLHGLGIIHQTLTSLITKSTFSFANGLLERKRGE